MGKPAAVIGSFHLCPKKTGKIPHVGGPVVMGSPNVKIGASLPREKVTNSFVSDRLTAYLRGLLALRLMVNRLLDQGTLHPMVEKFSSVYRPSSSGDRCELVLRCLYVLLTMRKYKSALFSMLHLGFPVKEHKTLTMKFMKNDFLS